MKILAVASIAGLLAASGCGATPTPEQHEHEHETDVMPEVSAVKIPEGGKLKVAATTSTVTHVVSIVGGDAIELTGIMEPGQDAHAFQPTPKDVAAMSDADLLFINGAGLEEFMHSVMENLGSGVVTVPVSAGIELAKGEEHGHEGEEHGHSHEYDPHTWTSPANVLVWVDNVEHALAGADPANAELYSANADAYREELREVDAWAKEEVAQVPPQNRKIVTNHEAWTYFCEHYGFEQVGAVIPAVTTSVEPSAQELAALAETMRGENVGVIFVDYEVSPTMSESIASETGAKVVRIWHELSPEGEGASTYTDWLRYNVTQFVENLK